jgi:hypothetical protein
VRGGRNHDRRLFDAEQFGDARIFEHRWRMAVEER